MCANSAWQHLVLLGWHCGFSPLCFFVACDWSDLSAIPCSCGFICSPQLHPGGQTAESFSIPPPCRTGQRLDYQVCGARGLCTLFLIQTLSWALSCVEAKLVCVTAQPGLKIKHRATFSWPTVAPLTLLEKQSRGGGRDLPDTYRSRFTSWRDLEQIIRSLVG